MENKNKNEILRKIPQIDEILKKEDLIFELKKYSHDYVVKVVREGVNDYKSNLLNSNNNIEFNNDDLIKLIKNKFD